MWKIDNAKITDYSRKEFNTIDQKIVKFLLEQIEKADKVGLINWYKFREYCIEFGDTDAPNILTVPIPVLDRCIKEARRTAKYTDTLNQKTEKQIDKQKQFYEDLTKILYRGIEEAEKAEIEIEQLEQNGEKEKADLLKKEIGYIKENKII